jgi:hypothetical protein
MHGSKDLNEFLIGPTLCGAYLTFVQNEFLILRDSVRNKYFTFLTLKNMHFSYNCHFFLSESILHRARFCGLRRQPLVTSSSLDQWLKVCLRIIRDSKHIFTLVL